MRRCYPLGVLPHHRALCALWLLGSGCSDGDRPQAPGRDSQRVEPRKKQSEHWVTHTVGAGETVHGISKRYGCSVQALIRKNGLRDPDLLRVGQQLYVPQASSTPTPSVSSGGVTKRVTPKPAGVSAFRHVLQRGETLWDLAHHYRIPLEDLLAHNGLEESAGQFLRDGQVIHLPEGTTRRRPPRVAPPKGAPPSASTANRLTARQRRISLRARRLGLGLRSTANTLLQGRQPEGWTRRVNRLGGWTGTLRWPVRRGWFVRGYGSGKGGYHLAVDIAGERGWNVLSAAPGVVAYAGDEVSGYGNLILLMHAHGFITMYAHNSVNRVVAGQRVKRGEVIALLGSTGISRGPHVHFEFMRHGKNCDPLPLFRPVVSSRSRSRHTVEPTRWRRKSVPPVTIRCGRRRSYPKDDL